MLFEHVAELGPVALVAVTASLFSRCCLAVFGSRLQKFEPDARWRLAFAAAVCPAGAATLFVLGASSDWLVSGPAAFCLLPRRGAEVSWVMATVACLALSAVAVRLTAVVLDLFRCRRSSRSFARASRPVGAFREIQWPNPVAFVAGLWRPEVYVSSGLRASIPADDLAVVVAHEQSHRRRRDPLRRMVANAALCLHLPHAAREISGLLGETQELVADRAATRLVGDPMRVAATLVRCGRLQSSVSDQLVAFSGASLEKRLSELVGRRASIERPTRAELFGALAALAFGCAFAGRALHFAWQLLLRLP